jgi:hypothetical protein
MDDFGGHVTKTSKSILKSRIDFDGTMFRTEATASLRRKTLTFPKAKGQWHGAP